MTIGKPDPAAPDPGPEPEDENLSPDQIVEKYGADLTDEVVAKMVMADLVHDRRLSIASDRKSKAEHATFDAWEQAYIRRYGTDEG